MSFKSILRIVLIATLCAFGCSSTIFAKAPPPESFGTLPAIYDAAISPDGTEYASISNFKGQYIVNIESLTGKKSKLRVVGLGKGVKPAYVKWVNN